MKIYQLVCSVAGTRLLQTHTRQLSKGSQSTSAPATRSEKEFGLGEESSEVIQRDFCHMIDIGEQ